MDGLWTLGHDIDITTSHNAIMSLSAATKSDIWPTSFSHPRVFDRETENTPYLTYFDDIHRTQYESDSESESSDNDSSDSESSQNDGEDDEVAVSGEESNDASDPRQTPAPEVRQSAVRRLKIGLGEEKECSIYPEHEYVVDFVEHSIDTRFKDFGADDAGLVAFIDDQSNTAGNVTAGETRRRAKPYRGGLTRLLFLSKLSNPVGFQNISSRSKV